MRELLTVAPWAMPLGASESSVLRLCLAVTFDRMPFLLKVQAPLRRFSRLERLLENTLTVLERWAFLAVMDSGAKRTCEPCSA
jgi:hypothetical protein